MGVARGLIPSAPRPGSLVPPRRPRVDIDGRPVAPDLELPSPDIPVRPNTPRLGADDLDATPSAPDAAPRTPDAPDAWVDVNTPWYRRIETLVPAGMTGGLVGVWNLLGGDNAFEDTGGTADLHAEQNGGGLNVPMDPTLRQKAMRSVEGRAAIGSKDAQDYLDRKQFADDLWRKKTLLAGGSHNINSGNIGILNALALLDPESRDRVLTQMMPINPMRASMEARQAEANAEVQAAMAARAPTEGERMAAGVARQNARLQMINGARAHIRDNYFNPGHWFGQGTQFTSAEYDSAVADIASMYDISEDEAREIVDLVRRTSK